MLRVGDWVHEITAPLEDQLAHASDSDLRLTFEPERRA